MVHNKPLNLLNLVQSGINCKIEDTIEFVTWMRDVEWCHRFRGIEH